MSEGEKFQTCHECGIADENVARYSNGVNVFTHEFYDQCIVALKARLAAAEREKETWRNLYRLAINEANGLTNYCEDRPGLRAAMKSIDAIQAQARAAIGATRATGGERCESDTPQCGPATHHDSDGVPLCAVCWHGLLDDSATGGDPRA